MIRKQIVLVPLLIAVIAAAVLVAVVRARSELRGPTIPRIPSPLDQKADKIDIKSYEVFSETLRDWTTQYAPDASGHYRNPRTGEYTMADLMKCASCGQLIPQPEIPPGLVPNLEPVVQRGRGGEEAMKARAAKGEAIRAAITAIRKFQLAYKCPRCGKNAFSFAPPPPPSKSQ